MSKIAKLDYSEINLDKIVKEIDHVQQQIQDLNTAAADEMLNIEHDYAKLKRPIYEKRGQLARRIPQFWFRAVVPSHTQLSNHPVVAQHITNEDVLIFRHLTALDVLEFGDESMSFEVSMIFDPNDYFFEEKLSRSFSLGPDSRLQSTPMFISWKKRRTEGTFFDFFTDLDVAGEVCEAIRNDVWLRPMDFLHN